MLRMSSRSISVDRSDRYDAWEYWWRELPITNHLRNDRIALDSASAISAEPMAIRGRVFVEVWLASDLCELSAFDIGEQIVVFLRGEDGTVHGYVTLSCSRLVMSEDLRWSECMIVDGDLGDLAWQEVSTCL